MAAYILFVYVKEVDDDRLIDSRESVWWWEWGFYAHFLLWLVSHFCVISGLIRGENTYCTESCIKKELWNILFWFFEFKQGKQNLILQKKRNIRNERYSFFSSRTSLISIYFIMIVCVFYKVSFGRSETAFLTFCYLFLRGEFWLSDQV